MFGKVKLKNVFACIVACAIAMMFAVPAWADNANKAAGAVTQGTIKKTVEANSSVDITQETFKFTATPVGRVNSNHAIDVDTTDFPSAGGSDTKLHAEITFDSNLEEGTTTASKNGSFDLSTLSFTKRGTYAYLIEEESGSTDDLTYSDDMYLMYVYATNGASGLEVSLVQFFTVADVTRQDSNGDGDTNDRDDEITAISADEKVDLPEFTNTYALKSNFKLAKKVTGAYGDKEQAFSVALTVSIPSGRTAPASGYEVTLYTHDEDGNLVGEGSSIQNDAETVFLLADSEYLTIENLPVGTTYTVTESATSDSPLVNYQTTVAVEASDPATGKALSGSATGVEGKGITSQDFTKSAANAAVIGPKGAYANNAVVTNKCTIASPTGVLISNLPYIVLIGIPLAALAAWIVIRKRRSSRAV